MPWLPWPLASLASLAWSCRSWWQTVGTYCAGWPPGHPVHPVSPPALPPSLPPCLALHPPATRSHRIDTNTRGAAWRVKQHAPTPTQLRTYSVDYAPSTVPLTHFPLLPVYAIPVHLPSLPRAIPLTHTLLLPTLSSRCSPFYISSSLLSFSFAFPLFCLLISSLLSSSFPLFLLLLFPYRFLTSPTHSSFAYGLTGNTHI